MIENALFAIPVALFGLSLVGYVALDDDLRARLSALTHRTVTQKHKAAGH